MELFLTNQPPEQGSEEVTKTELIDRSIMSLQVGESVPFPIAEKGTITARVSDLNKLLEKSGDPRRWRTQSDKIHFQILVIRES